MRYHELSVEIRTGVGLEAGESVVEVRSGNYGRGAVPFRLPFAPERLDRLLPVLERRVRGVEAPRRPVEEGSASGDPETPDGTAEPPTDPAVLGEALFGALFHGDTASTFHRTFGRVEDRRDADGTPLGLRIRFLFAPEDPDLSPLSVVPWEVLRRPDTRDYLARGRRTPVVRSIDVPRPVRPLEVEPPLRVLLVEPAPVDLRGLDLFEERRRIREALERLPGRVELVPLPRPELSAVRQALLAEPIHAVHFMGHGDLTDDGEGVLYFETPSGWSEPVPAETFASQLQEIDTLKLVVLNACVSGALPRHRGRDPFSATAASLTMLGIPAVVAMQFPVSDGAAIAFSRTLYGRLAALDPVEAAVAEGRLAILADRPRSAEWITPVLYLRGDSGRLFEAPSDPDPGPEPEPVRSRPEPPESRPLRLGVRSMEGLGEGLEEEADEVLSLVEHFDGRLIRDERLWLDTILPELRTFLAAARTSGRPLLLDLAAHQSIAFLCGALLEAKSGVNLSVVQRGQAGTAYWFPARPGETMQEPGWSEPAPEQGGAEDRPSPAGRDPDARDVAVAVSVTHPVLTDVETYLNTSGLRVRRILRASLPEPSSTAVRDGAHALRLAQTLARRIRGRPPAERGGTVHLFAAAPNALLLFLGQLAPLLGRVRVYEYDLEAGEPGGYWPGVEADAGKIARPRSRQTSSGSNSSGV